MNGVGRRLSAVFFDRDGTLNCSARAGEYIRRPEELRLLPGAGVAVRRVNSARLPAIVVTNQRWLSEPGADPGRYRLIEAKLEYLLATHGARLDASYTCPHALNSCDCRKPLPGLLLRAADKFGLELSASFLVGNSMSDIQAGLAVGATTILISSDPCTNADRLAHYVVPSAEDAVARILDASHRRSSLVGE